MVKRAIVLVLLVVAYQGCKDEATPPEIPERIKLTLIDVAVKEAYLHVATSNPASNETLALQRNGATVMTFPAVADTNIADTALTQTTTYQYTATLRTSTTTGKSNTITAQTLAPTSHNFTWQTFLLGDGNNSSLSGVAIINDTLIYAVGELYLNGDYMPYNLAKWNGHSWQIERVPYYYQGQAFYGQIRAVWAFSSDNIWFGIGNLIHWDGHTYTSFEFPSNVWGPYRVNRMWGSQDGNSLYVVGEGGSIAYSSNRGTTWQRIESGTAIDIKDLWGGKNPVTQQEEIVCVASMGAEFPQARKILRVSGTVVTLLPDSGLPLNLYSIWFKAGSIGYLTGSGIFQKMSPFENFNSWKSLHAGVTPYHTTSVRGTGLNDIMIVGDFGEALHFNGLTWRSYRDAIGLPNGIYRSVACLGDQVVAVGFSGDRAVIAYGKRI